MNGSYILLSSKWGKWGKFVENCSFSRWIQLDWGSTTWVNMEGLGSIRIIWYDGQQLVITPWPNDLCSCKLTC